MTKPILIAYATNAGSTADVAQAVGKELGKCGAIVEARRLEDVSSLEGYAAAVIGGPMIFGWHASACKFVRQHRRALGQMPVAYFGMAMALTQIPGSDMGGVAMSIDPALGKPPAQAGKLSLRERFTLVTNYARPMLRSAPLVKPVSIAFFKGKLDLYRLNWLYKLFVLLVIQAKPGDYRNWPAIQSWAASLYPLLGVDL